MLPPPDGEESAAFLRTHTYRYPCQLMHNEYAWFTHNLTNEWVLVGPLTPQDKPDDGQ